MYETPGKDNLTASPIPGFEPDTFFLSVHRKIINQLICYQVHAHRTRWSSGRVLSWCVGGRGFDSWSGHTKDFKNGT